MANVGKKHHKAITDGDVVGVSNAYSTAKVHTMLLMEPPLFSANNQPFLHHLEYVRFTFKAIAGGATKVTFKLCSDTAGNFAVTPSTLINIDLGTTDATVGTASAKIDISPYIESDLVYVFIKTDSGTVTLDQTVMTWSE